MENEEKKEEIVEDEVVKALREEYEAKLTAKDEEHKKAIEELEAKHIAQLKALVSGRVDTPKEDEKPKPEKSLEEILEEKLNKRFNTK